jgi:hypothetical protein
MSAVLQLSAEEARQARAILTLFRAIAQRKEEFPDEAYAPSFPGQPLEGGRAAGPYANQLAFHKATQTIRLLAPGNGWGKTTAAGAEANAWAMHHNLWQETPPWPVRMVWFCKAYDQFELIRYQLQETVFSRGARWVKDRFVWPDGSTMAIGSAGDSTTWRRWQGPAIDLVLFDEQPPRQLWREMRMRRRGKKKTRYVFAMTATEGESWVEEEIYQPWLKFHADRGLDEERALWAQLDPDTFVWHRGGIVDNPAADDEDRRWYEAGKWSSEKERQVRLHGGFQRWVGDAIFDEAALAAALELLPELDKAHGAGRTGFFTWARGWGEPDAPRLQRWQKPKRL